MIDKTALDYLSFVDELKRLAEPNFAEFQKRLIITSQTILGVRTPMMRKIAKRLESNKDIVLDFPDEYYEVTFIKLIIVSKLPYEEFIMRLPRAVASIDNWATCDSFKNKSVALHKREFLSVIDEIFHHGGEFYQRYALVNLLWFYTEEEYIPLIENYLVCTNTTLYYAKMAAAWLVSEILIKCYLQGVRLLSKGILDKQTHNIAIRKAIESYRLTKQQKDELRSLKI